MDKNYYLVGKLNDKFSDLTNHFSVLEEVLIDNKIRVKSVTNTEMLDKLYKYFEKRAMNY